MLDNSEVDNEQKQQQEAEEDVDDRQQRPQEKRQQQSTQLHGNETILLISGHGDKPAPEYIKWLRQVSRMKHNDEAKTLLLRSR